MLVALTEDGNRIYADEAQKRDANGNKNKFYWNFNYLFVWNIDAVMEAQT